MRQEILEVRLQEFSERHNQLVIAASSLYPFVQEDIYRHIEECMKRSQIERLHINSQRNEIFSIGWYEDGAKQREIFDEHYYTAVRLSCERFGELTIMSLPH